MPRLIGLILVLGLLAVPLSIAADGDPLAEWGVHATQGAAAGYVDDAACAECHADKAETYAEVGMAKSFYRATGATVIEDFSTLPFFHEPSGRYYDMARKGEEYHFRRYRLAPDGSEVDVFERRVDWIMGSGHHVRTYIYQTTDGAMFEIPLAWYSQDGFWEMNPGFEFEDHPGVQRLITQRCMACHNGFPEVPLGSDAVGMPDVFPHELPQGLGCQRCHGPGADHVRLAISGEGDTDAVRAQIVNPGHLPREQLYSVCYSCHMQPTVAVASQLRGDRGVYSFRPGEDIADYLTHIEITELARPRSERFEINHHPYRMEQSACFVQSGGQLGCLTCHDPHVKRKPEERAAHYREACLSCHTTDDNDLPVLVSGRPHPEIAQADDCTTCHMPTRRTQDVIHVTMTDHKISRGPFDLAALIAPISKEPPVVSGVELLRPGHLSGDEEAIQKIAAIFSYGSSPTDGAADTLNRILTATDWPTARPWIDLAKSQFDLERFDMALAAAEAALTRSPANPTALNIRAVSLWRLGRQGEALSRMEEARALWPDDVTLLFNHAVLLAISQRYHEAIPLARRAVALRDNHWAALRLLGDLANLTDDPETAIRAYLEALSAEPRTPRVRDSLIDLLIETGRPDEAARHVVVEGR